MTPPYRLPKDDIYIYIGAAEDDEVAWVFRRFSIANDGRPIEVKKKGWLRRFRLRKQLSQVLLREKLGSVPVFYVANSRNAPRPSLYTDVL